MNLDEFKKHVEAQREASKAEALAVLAATIKKQCDLNHFDTTACRLDTARKSYGGDLSFMSDLRNTLDPCDTPEIL